MSEKQQSYPYDPPVADLLTAGDVRNRPWLDYLSVYGFTPDHTPDLIRLMQDEELHLADSDSDEVWAPLHAWRALGQLGDPAAVEAIVALLPRIDGEYNSDWEQEELPLVLGMIGSPAIPVLGAFLANPQHGLYARAAAATAIGKIAQADKSLRAECIAVLANQLGQHEQQDPTFNAFIISDLIDLRAVEAAEAMADAFEAENVDFFVAGDWEEVQMELGLQWERSTPKPEYGWIPDEYVPLAQTVREKFRQNPSGSRKEKKQTAVPKVGRNDPCPCGSGLKYKKCHGKLG
jgi:hypothetical protein